MPSTVIRKIEYEPASECLKIYFVSGLAYVYYNVPEAVYWQFKNFREKGIYFNQHIKNTYNYKRIEE